MPEDGTQNRSEQYLEETRQWKEQLMASFFFLSLASLLTCHLMNKEPCQIHTDRCLMHKRCKVIALCLCISSSLTHSRWSAERLWWSTQDNQPIIVLWRYHHLSCDFVFHDYSPHTFEPLGGPECLLWERTISTSTDWQTRIEKWTAVDCRSVKG